MSERALGELEAVHRSLIAMHLEKDLKSARVLRELRRSIQTADFAQGRHHDHVRGLFQAHKWISVERPRRRGGGAEEGRVASGSGRLLLGRLGFVRCDVLHDEPWRTVAPLAG